MIKTILLLIISACFYGCSSVNDISSDTRFEGLSNEQIITKEKLRLYDVNPHETDRHGRYNLTYTDMGDVALGGGSFIGDIPIGSRIKFERILQFQGGVERFEGVLLWGAKRYPFSYYMGSGVYPESWKLLFDSFEINEQK